MPYNAPGLNSPVHFEGKGDPMVYCNEDTNKKPDRTSGQASCSRNSMRKTICLAASCSHNNSSHSVNIQVALQFSMETVGALVAQSIEQPHAKGQVVGANPAEGVSIIKRGRRKVVTEDQRTVWSGILTAVPSGKPLFTRTTVRSLRSRPDQTSGRTLCRVTPTHAVLIGGN